ncbi:MAG: nuclear transport factor 2 family protein [Pseudohongiellaceae bacterium]
MKLLKLAAGIGALLLGTQVIAQDPVTGTPDESLFTDSDPVLHRNKQAALHIMRELLQCNQWSRAGEWLTDRYIQHNPNAASGLEGVIYYFVEVAKRQPTESCDKLTTPIAAVMAEDDLVTVMIPRTYKHPVTGADYTSTWFDTWRFVDGKADEHWDPATITPPAGN